MQNTQDTKSAPRRTKYVRVFVVQGHYGQHGWEDLCCDTDRKLARENWREYRENTNDRVRLITRRVLREKFETEDF